MICKQGISLRYLNIYGPKGAVEPVKKQKWNIYKEDKAISVTGRGDTQGCETSRLPHFLDNRLTDSSAVVSLMHRLPFTSRKVPGTHFC
jgi:hypothetical protein